MKWKIIEIEAIGIPIKNEILVNIFGFSFIIKNDNAAPNSAIGSKFDREKNPLDVKLRKIETRL